MRNKLKMTVAAMALMAAGTGSATAAEKVFGDVGFYYTSHFVSYGLDVWGGGDDFFGSRSTGSLYADVGIKLTDNLTWTANGWSDLNTNVPSAIGGSLQEVDINTGFTYAFGNGFTGSIVYGAWSYAGDVEDVIDTSLAFDDTGMLFDGVAFMPKVTWHYRASGNGAQDIGSAIVFSVGPAFPLGSDITLAIPAGVAFFTTDTFQGGTDSGLGYGYFGGSLSTPLSFIDPAFGAWSVNFDLVGYFTDNTLIPGNPKENFVTGTFGIKMAF